MKILFVCRQNVGRSQIAKAFYNSMTQTSDADAAGTNVVEVGQSLQQRKETSKSHNFFVIDVMNEQGIDISNYVRDPLNERVLTKYDKIISMANEKDVPKWLLESSKYTYWNIIDPRGHNYATTAKVRDEIKRKVTELINE